MHKEQLACRPYAFNGARGNSENSRDLEVVTLEMDAVFDTIAQACPSH
jgi:hypothetical protein